MSKPSFAKKPQIPDYDPVRRFTPDVVNQAQSSLRLLKAKRGNGQENYRQTEQNNLGGANTDTNYRKVFKPSFQYENSNGRKEEQKVDHQSASILKQLNELETYFKVPGQSQPTGFKSQSNMKPEMKMVGGYDYHKQPRNSVSKPSQQQMPSKPAFARKQTSEYKTPTRNHDYEDEPHEDFYSNQPKSKPTKPFANKPMKPAPKPSTKGRSIPNDDEEYREVKTYPCPEGCGRKFAKEALEKHVKACVKIFQSKRKEFDSGEQRLLDGQTKAKPGRRQPSKQRELPKAKGKKDWKKESEAFRAAIKNAKGTKLTDQEQRDLDQMQTAGLVHCQYCGRNFNENAAEKHIPFCKKKADQAKYRNGPPKRRT